jgi:hypothetical protein
MGLLGIALNSLWVKKAAKYRPLLKMMVQTLISWLYRPLTNYLLLSFAVEFPLSFRMEKVLSFPVE